MSSTTPLRVLLVEDSRTQAHLLKQTLDMDPKPFDVVRVDCLRAALESLNDSAVDLILLDLVLPDSEGLDTFAAVHTAYPELPIIVLSGSSDETIALRAVADGAQDYLFKATVSPEVLTRSIRYAMERHRTLRQLRNVALFDDLTGVYNRRGFMFLAEQNVAAARASGTPITILYLDVDHLKQINDLHGHLEGDRALTDVADILRGTFRAADLVGRIGGDEFCVLLVDDTEPPAAVNRLRRAVDALNAPGHREFELCCSIGATSQQPVEGSTLADALRRADRAMYAERDAKLVMSSAIRDTPLSTNL
jgi:two-component system, cell cycle response regulator